MGHEATQNLVLITNHFPFGLGESFLETELPYLQTGFAKILIIARDRRSQLHRNLDATIFIERLDTESTLTEKLGSIPFLLQKFPLLKSIVAEEVNFLRKKGRFSLRIARRMFHDLFKAVITAGQIEKIIRRHNLQGRITLYSYWLTSNALATTLVSARGLSVIRISRAHGVDVYDSRNSLKYLSFRSGLSRLLDHVFCISENGSTYIRQQVPSQFHSKITISRLGTLHAGESRVSSVGHRHLVSCSFLVPVKQVHRIIEALSHIESLKIKWTHIGGGPLQEAMEALAEEKLSGKDNLQYQFLGAITNEQIMAFYRANYVDLFINTSQSEGIPVTMMEAQSFGIPILAPDVGGISEIVSSDNGKLFRPDASSTEIAKQLTSLLGADCSEMRLNARRSWEQKYNAEKNFSTFVGEISNL